MGWRFGEVPVKDTVPEMVAVVEVSILDAGALFREDSGALF